MLNPGRKEDNPFTFDKFDAGGAAEVPFPLDEPAKKAKKKTGKPKKSKAKKSAKMAQEQPAHAAPPGSDEDDNPFGFKAFASTNQPTARTQEAPQPAPIPAPVPVVASHAPLLPSAMGADSDFSSSDDDAAGSLPRPTPRTSQSSAASSYTGPGVALNGGGVDSDMSSSSDSDGNSGPRPVRAVPAPAATDAGVRKGSSGILDRVKRRMALLQEELKTTKQQLSNERERCQLDVGELTETVETLRAQMEKYKTDAKRATKKMSTIEAELTQRRSTEQREANVLEQFTSRVEKNLEQTTARATAAEQQVAHLTQENARLRNELQNHSLSGGAVEQVHAASSQLESLAVDSEKALRELCKGIGKLQLASQILASVGKVTEQ